MANKAAEGEKICELRELAESIAVDLTLVEAGVTTSPTDRLMQLLSGRHDQAMKDLNDDNLFEIDQSEVSDKIMGISSIIPHSSEGALLQIANLNCTIEALTLDIHLNNEQKFLIKSLNRSLASLRAYIEHSTGGSIDDTIWAFVTMPEPELDPSAPGA